MQLNEHFFVQMPKFLSIFFCNAGMVRLVTLVDTLTVVVDTGGVVYDANDYSASSNYSNVMSRCILCTSETVSLFDKEECKLNITLSLVLSFEVSSSLLELLKLNIGIYERMNVQLRTDVNFIYHWGNSNIGAIFKMNNSRTIAVFRGYCILSE